MTIRAYTPEIELKPGMWVNVDFMMIHGFAGRAGRVKSIKAASVVIEDFRLLKDGTLEADGESLKRKSSILFVCDTAVEAFHMTEKSREFRELAYAKEAELKVELAALKLGAIAAALILAF